MEKGFYHSSRGYWQTLSEPSAEILTTYPEGTVEVPLKPHAYCVWDGSAWVDVPPPLPTAEEVRAERDRLLAASDWTQVADAPVDQAAWAIYRQALRDVPDQAGFPENVIWPETPNAE
jgi:hypothetical protein